MSAQSPITMFGAYVSNLSVSLGWGGQGGSMQLTLVEDPDNGVTIPRRNGQVFNGGERDGVVAPPTGTACYFKYGSFYFGGIFQRWTYKVDAVGGATYDVILESPSKLMDGVQLIIENFNGTTDIYANNFNDFEFSTNVGASNIAYGENGLQLHNVYNIFGYYENPFFGGGDEPIAEALENFGLSRFNSSGTPIREIWTALDFCAKKNSPSIWGGPIRFGDPSGGEYGVTEFDLDVTEALKVYNRIGIDFFEDLKDIRVSGPVKSVNGFISEAAEFHQWDYFYTVEPVGGQSAINQLADGGGLIDSGRAVIKLKTADKTNPPQKDKIRQFIDAELTKDDSEKTIMNYSIGKEWADATTQKIIWGGRRSRYVEVSGRINSLGQRHPSVDNSFAVWGRRPSVVSESYNFVGEAGSVYSQPFVPQPIFIKTDAFGESPYMVTPFELRMALAGKEAWLIYKTMEIIAGRSFNGPLGGWNLVTSPFTAKVEPTKEILNLLIEDCANEFDMLLTNTSKALNRWDDARLRLGDQIFSGVSKIAEDSYKQEYYVFLPNEYGNRTYNIYYPDDESEDYRSWRVSSSAFVERGRYAPALDVTFFDGSGRMKPVAGYPLVGRNGGNADFSNLGSDYAIGVNGANGLVLTQSGGPQGEDRWNDLFRKFGVFCKGAKCREYDSITTPDFGLTVLAKLLYNIDIAPDKYIRSAKPALQFAIPPDILEPTYFGIPQESERFSYGPWVTVRSSDGGNFDRNGRASAEEISQLVPETYGSYGLLRAVGQKMTEVADSHFHQSESGFVQVVGAPSFNLGDRFAGTGPYVTSMDISVDATGGVSTSYKFNTWTSEFGKLAKYNIDRIAKINKNSWTASQTLRGRISKPPFPATKFEKTDFSKLPPVEEPNLSGFGTINMANQNAEEQGIEQDVV